VNRIVLPLLLQLGDALLQGVDLRLQRTAPCFLSDELPQPVIKAGQTYEDYPGDANTERPSYEIQRGIHIDVGGFSLPNVKDEPRPWLARRVRHDDLDSVASFGNSFGSTRRDGHGRWLWRLVRLFLDSLFLTLFEDCLHCGLHLAAICGI
jgi:hypothetical protein